MSITTNGIAIYAPQTATIEEICQELETNEALWNKVAKHKLRGVRESQLTPREWVLQCQLNDVVIRSWRNEALVKENKSKHASEKLTCEDCGRVVARGQWSRHIKSSVHLKALGETPDDDDPVTTKAKERAKKWVSQKITCEVCKRVVTRGKWSKHLRSAVHIKAAAQTNPNGNLSGDDPDQTNSSENPA